jgi:hypothetical protein
MRERVGVHLPCWTRTRGECTAGGSLGVCIEDYAAQNRKENAI